MLLYSPIMNETLRKLYQQHLKTLASRWHRALEQSSVDATVLWAGHSVNYLFDDQPPPFRANPHLLQWLPYLECEQAALVVRPEANPTLYFYQPEDYWHLPPALPEWASDGLEVKLFTDVGQLVDAVTAAVAGSNRLSSIGAATDNAALPQAQANPTSLLAALDFMRGVKTPFELECMRLATDKAVTGHRAAADAFAAGESEFQINLAYLAASRQSATDLPYGNIVGLNEHAGVLHYQHQNLDVPAPYLSLLIDAGGRSFGYAADVTRTYAKSPGIFADLIAELDTQQLELIDSIKPGQNYLELHADMHQRITKLLCDAGVFQTSLQEAAELRLSESFFPHGLGHLLGLQTHDVAGQQLDTMGTLAPPPQHYPALRLTRQIDVGQTFTIEPGIYFIPMLLDALRERLAQVGRADALNESLVRELMPYGGIRIEDNVCVLAQGIENFTRDAFAATT